MEKLELNKSYLSVHEEEGVRSIFVLHPKGCKFLTIEGNTVIEEWDENKEVGEKELESAQQLLNDLKEEGEFTTTEIPTEAIGTELEKLLPHGKNN